MSKELSKNKQTIKYYHILLLSIILSQILIINSNYVVEKRNRKKLNLEADKKWKEIVFGRHLESFEEGMKKICNKGTEELEEYYKSGALSKLDIDITKKEEEEENPEYIKALLDIVKGYVGEESEKDIMDNAKTYGLHVLGIGIFLGFAILSIPGWIICCSCCCCNCCCCCCCKKASCKCPFFIVTTVLYVLVAVVCIFGLIKSNYIFKGVADTECSILKFFNEIIKGETKEEKPKWAGIEGLDKLIDDLNNKIVHLQTSKLSELRTKNGQIAGYKTTFETTLEGNSGNAVNYAAVESIDSNDYKLDITTQNEYGLFNKAAQEVDPPGSFIGRWFIEYSETARQAEDRIGTATQQFETILGGSSVTTSLDDAKSTVDEIGKSIEEIKNGVSDIIIEYSDYIDDYGKLGFKLYFSVLVVIDGLIAILMFLLCFCSGKLCNKCCCCRCIFKFCIHLLWNILALLMIITFMIGFLFSFIGTVGKDMVSVLNYFISEDNLGKEEPTLFGEAGTKLNSCFNGDGVILNNLDAMGSFDELNDKNEEITAYERTFDNLSNQKYAYERMRIALEERVGYTNCDFEVKATSNGASIQSYKLSDLINDFNNANSESNYYLTCSCDTIPTGKDCLYIKEGTISSSVSNVDANAIAGKILKIKELVNKANDDNEGSNSFYKMTQGILSAYETFLTSELGILRLFKETIEELNSLFDEYVGENGSVLDFINCKFIGNNILVILNNIKNSLGGDFYTVGVCLLMAGCSMAISICFTILLIIIINISVDQNKKEN